jgi:hypothetical protein
LNTTERRKKALLLLAGQNNLFIHANDLDPDASGKVIRLSMVSLTTSSLCMLQYHGRYRMNVVTHKILPIVPSLRFAPNPRLEELILAIQDITEY